MKSLVLALTALTFIFAQDQMEDPIFMDPDQF